MASALSFPDPVRRLRLKVAAQPNHLDQVCRAFRSKSSPVIINSTRSVTPLNVPWRPSKPSGDRRIAHPTQGSGKSMLMAFYAGRIILRQTPQQAESREHLQTLLTRPSGGVIFTTLQKFAPDKGVQNHPLLTDRRNVIVIADEAHRSQYGFKAKVDRKTGDLSYGFAKYLRDALPNTAFIGLPAHRLKKTTPTPRRCLAITSTSMTSTAPSRMGQPCCCTTKAACPVSN